MGLCSPCVPGSPLFSEPDTVLFAEQINPMKRTRDGNITVDVSTVYPNTDAALFNYTFDGYRNEPRIEMVARLRSTFEQ